MDVKMSDVTKDAMMRMAMVNPERNGTSIKKLNVLRLGDAMQSIVTVL